MRDVFRRSFNLSFSISIVLKSSKGVSLNLSTAVTVLLVRDDFFSLCGLR